MLSTLTRDFHYATRLAGVVNSILAAYDAPVHQVKCAETAGACPVQVAVREEFRAALAGVLACETKPLAERYMPWFTLYLCVKHASCRHLREVLQGMYTELRKGARVPARKPFGQGVQSIAEMYIKSQANIVRMELDAIFTNNIHSPAARVENTRQFFSQSACDEIGAEIDALEGAAEAALGGVGAKRPSAEVPPGTPSPEKAAREEKAE